MASMERSSFIHSNRAEVGTRAPRQAWGGGVVSLVTRVSPVLVQHVFQRHFLEDE